MRGQESGSEHEHETDGSAAPATPPPSFGQPVPPVLGTDQSVSESFSGSSDDDPERSGFGGSRRDAPFGDPVIRAPDHPPIPVFRGPPPDLPAPEHQADPSQDATRPGRQPFAQRAEGSSDLPALPALPAFPPAQADALWGRPAQPWETRGDGAQPYEARGDVAQPYDWFIDPPTDEPTSPEQPAWAAEAEQPTARWAPPSPQPPAPAWAPPPQADTSWQPPQQGDTSWQPQQPQQPQQPETPWSPEQQGPSWAPPPQGGRSWPAAQAESPGPPGDAPGAPVPPWQAQQEQGPHGQDPHGQDPHGQGPHGQGPHGQGPHGQGPQADPAESPSWQPPPAFTAAAAGMQVWPAPVGDTPAMPPWPAATGELAEEEADEPPFDPTMTAPDAIPLEPGDVPVWPPKPPDDDPQAETTVELHQEGQRHEEQRHEEERQGEQEQLPDLPFGPEVWGPKPAAEPTEPPAATGPPPPPSAAGGLMPLPGQSALPVPTGQSALPVPTGQSALPVPTGPPVDQPTPPAGIPFQPFGGPPQPQFPPPPPVPEPGKSKKALLATLSVLMLAGIGTGAFFAYRSINASPPADATASQSSASPTETGDPAQTDPLSTSALNSEGTDPEQLSLVEAFPDKKVKINGITYTRVKATLAPSCHKAAAGPFAEALREQKCSRVLRATYVDNKRRYAITTGIAVLPSKEAAMEADQAKDLGDNLWFRALPGAADTGAERVHIAGGYAAGLVWGRYIVFSYATYADGHTPTAKEKSLGPLSGAFRDQTSLVLERRITD